MQVPQELRWIGPLFLVVYLVLWARRGLASIFALFVFPFMNMYFMPPILLVMIIVLGVIGWSKRYRITGIVLFLCLILSGVMLEIVPVTFTGPHPPPASILLFTIYLITPIFSISSLFLMIYQNGIFHPMFLGLLILTILPYPTSLVVWFASKGRIDSVYAILYLVIILICWTLLVIPMSMNIGLGMLLTPMPLGPLVALNILPWIPVDNAEQLEHQV